MMDQGLSDEYMQKLIEEAKREEEQKTPSNIGKNKAEKKYSGPTNRFGRPKGNTIRGKTTFPRNKPCFCGSGKKFKKCCASL